MRSLLGIIISSIVLVASAFVLEPDVFAQNLDATKSGVVKITTKNGQVGAGFIVRVEQEMVYIIYSGPCDCWG